MFGRVDRRTTISGASDFLGLMVATSRNGPIAGLKSGMGPYRRFVPAADICSAATKAFDRLSKVSCPKTDLCHLSVDHRLCRAWCRNRVGMPMNKLPRAALKAKDTGHTHGY